MKNRNYLAAAFLVVAALVVPMTASALSINDYEKETPLEQGHSYNDAVLQAIADANPLIQILEWQ